MYRVKNSGHYHCLQLPPRMRQSWKRQCTGIFVLSQRDEPRLPFHVGTIGVIKLDKKRRAKNYRSFLEMTPLLQGRVKIGNAIIRLAVAVPIDVGKPHEFLR
jgi:hypothetical protein